MAPQEILIVTTERDMNSEMVIEELRKRHASYSRFDTDAFNGKIKTTLNLSPNGIFEGTLHFPGKDLS